MTEEAKTTEPPTCPAVSVVGPRGGETIAVDITRMRVQEGGNHTGQRLAITESVLAPRPSAEADGTHER